MNKERSAFLLGIAMTVDILEQKNAITNLDVDDKYRLLYDLVAPGEKECFQNYFKLSRSDRGLVRIITEDGLLNFEAAVKRSKAQEVK